MSNTTAQLPTALYEDLLVKLVAVLHLIQSCDVNAHTKQALFQAINSFKNAMSQARELAITLPGGEMLVEEQDEVIGMLERFRDLKKEQLSHFSDCALSSTLILSEQHKMEVDSMASTPYAPS